MEKGRWVVVESAGRWCTTQRAHRAPRGPERTRAERVEGGKRFDTIAVEFLSALTKGDAGAASWEMPGGEGRQDVTASGGLGLREPAGGSAGCRVCQRSSCVAVRYGHTRSMTQLGRPHERRLVERCPQKNRGVPRSEPERFTLSTVGEVTEPRQGMEG